MMMAMFQVQDSSWGIPVDSEIKSTDYEVDRHVALELHRQVDGNASAVY